MFSKVLQIKLSITEWQLPIIFLLADYESKGHL